MIKHLVIMLILLGFYTPNWVSANQSCQMLFSDKLTHQEVIMSTKQLKSYIQNLLEMKLIQIKDLELMKENLQNEIWFNPVPHEKTKYGVIFGKASSQIHFEALEQMVSNSKINFKDVAEWLSEISKEEKATQKKREKTQEDTHDLFVKMSFNPVQPAEYELGVLKWEKRPAKVEKPFEMMSTLVTQWQWAIVMGENPSHFISGERSIDIKINSKSIRALPDNPVESVTWENVLDFIKKINDMSEKNDPTLQKIIPDHQMGYKYRLPTEEEWELVGRNQSAVIYHSHEIGVNLNDYVWHFGNSERRTHPVCQTLPLKFEGNDFYDLHGNVWEWTADEVKLKSGALDLYGNPNLNQNNLSVHRVIRGGSWEDVASFSKKGTHMNNKHNNLGFRLVREKI